MIIRDALIHDLDAIAKIWNFYIWTTTFNWRHEGYTLPELEQWHSQHGTPDRPVLVVEQEDAVLGFGALSTFRGSTGYRYTAEDTIYLAPDARNRGLGTLLMNALLKRGKEGGLWQVVSMIDSRNTQSIDFHAKMGFLSVGVLEDIGEKDGKTLSCAIMQRKLV